MIIKVRLTEDVVRLDEARRLSQILRFIENKRPFVMISPITSDMTADEEEKVYKEMKIDLRRLGYGYNELIGFYTPVDDNGNPIEEEGSEELSFIVPNMSLDDALKLGKKYNQQSVLYFDGEKFSLVDCNTGEEIVSDDISGKSVRDVVGVGEKALKLYYSKLRKGPHSNKYFKLKVFERITGINSLHNLALEKQGLLGKYIELFGD